jgi:hypothetical protein
MSDEAIMSNSLFYFIILTGIVSIIIVLKIFVFKSANVSNVSNTPTIPVNNNLGIQNESIIRKSTIPTKNITHAPQDLVSNPVDPQIPYGLVDSPNEFVPTLIRMDSILQPNQFTNVQPIILIDENAQNSDIASLNALNSNIVVNNNAALNSNIVVTNNLNALNSNIVANTLLNASLMNGLVKYYRFEVGDIDNNGRLANWATGTPVFDASIKNGASINTADYKVGKSSLYLNGNSQYVLMDPFIITNTGITITTWFKFSSGGWTRLFEFGNGAESSHFLYSAGNGLSVIHNGARITQPGYGGYANSNWNFFAWTLTKNDNDNYGTWNVYMNNVLIYNNTRAGYPLAIRYAINYLGFSNWGGDGYSTGYIDDFRYYTRVLSTNEMTHLFNLNN